MATKALILAAGKGTRVQPLTYDMPKPMIPILGRPVIEMLVEQLAKHGIRDIMINVSYHAYRIEQYLGDGSRYGVNIGYSFEGTLDGDELIPEPIGSAGALGKIQRFGDFFDDTTVVLCGDALIDLDLTAALSEHRATRALASVITIPVAPDKVSNYGIVVTDKDGRVTSFQEKPSIEDAKSNLASTGIYIFEPGVIDLIPSSGSYDIGSQLFPQLLEGGYAFFAQRHQFNWIDIGRVSDYWAVMMDLMRKPIAGTRMPGRQLRSGIWCGLNIDVPWNEIEIRGPVFIGSNSRIAPATKIVGPVWIGHGSCIEMGSHIERSVLFEHTLIRSKSIVRNMILSGKFGVTGDGRELSSKAPGDNRYWGDARSHTKGSNQRTHAK